jgi:3'(2'), 5'-bisphosphate nucleotidase
MTEISKTLDLQRLLAAVRLIAEEAGRATLCFYGSVDSTLKADGSPVTAADQAAEDIILTALRRLTPHIPVISEEEASKGLCPDVSDGLFWLVDPLDGTKEFISGNNEFTVNIALISEGIPVLGVVVVPALGETYSGCTPGTAVLSGPTGQSTISVRSIPRDGVTVIGSRSHGDAAALEAFLKERKVAAFRAAGSSLKLCLIARGEADLYPRLGTTMEWDIAAGHAVLSAAGGQVETLDGIGFRYGKLDYRNPHFVAFGSKV